MLQSIVGLPALVFACTSCYAGVVVGYPLPLNTEPNSAPFGDTGSFVITRYQQVYSDTAFGSQVLITDLEFFTNDVVFGNYIQAGTYAISLSTTAKAVNGLDTVDLNNKYW